MKENMVKLSHNQISIINPVHAYFNGKDIQIICKAEITYIPGTKFPAL